jgi:hypothetical protein
MNRASTSAGFGIKTLVNTRQYSCFNFCFVQHYPSRSEFLLNPTRRNRVSERILPLRKRQLSSTVTVFQPVSGAEFSPLVKKPLFSKPDRVPVLAMIASRAITNLCVIIQTPDKLRTTERKINGFG